MSSKNGKKESEATDLEGMIKNGEVLHQSPLMDNAPSDPSFTLSPASLNNLRNLYYRFEGYQAAVNALVAEGEKVANKYNEALFATKSAFGIPTNVPYRVNFTEGTLEPEE